MSLRSAREHSSDPLNPVFNRYQDELIQLRNQRTLIEDPTSKRIHLDSRSRLKWYDCFNQQQVTSVKDTFQYPLEPDYNDLSIWYRMDYAGNLMKDKSLFDNHANIAGNPRLVEGLNYGQFGGTTALQFDGASDYLYTPEGTKNAGRISGLSSGFSVGTIIFPQRLQNPEFENACLFYKKDTDSSIYAYSAMILETGKLFFAVRINGGLTKKRTVTTPVGTPAAFTTDYNSDDYDIVNYLAGGQNYLAIPNWFLIWFVSDQANPPNLKIYVNGTNMTLETASEDSETGEPSTHETIVGAGRNGAQRHFQGIYQDYRFMKRQVTQTEVTRQMTNKVSISNIPYGKVFTAGGSVFGPAPSIFFDGINDYVDLGNDATLWSQSLTKFSWSVWVYPTILASGGINRDILRHGNSGAARFRADIDGTTSGDIKFYIRNNADNADSTARAAGLVLNQWQQIIGSYDNSLGSANVRIYRNGVIGYQTANHTEAKNLSAILSLSEATTDFQGYKKDFKWWTNHGVNTTEALEIFNGTYAIEPDYWLPMTEGFGNPVDSISKTKVGTLTNGPVWEFNK